MKKEGKIFCLLFFSILFLGSLIPTSSISALQENSDNKESFLNSSNLKADNIYANPSVSKKTEINVELDISPTEKLRTFGEIVSRFSLPSSYQDATVKVVDDAYVEYLIKTTNSEITDVLQNFLDKYDVHVVEKGNNVATSIIHVPIEHIQSLTNNFPDRALQHSEIKFIQPNFYYEAAYIPDDTYWADQWGPQIMGMTDAWDVQLGSSSIRVAVVDTGIDYAHPDLSNQYLAIGYDFVNSDSNPMDDNGHGTHCAGTIAASINNALGIAGIADVSVFAEKGLDEWGYGDSDSLAACIDHAVSQGADVISNSWGGYGEDTLISTAVANAVLAGVVVVAAAGNDNTDMLFYPAAYPDVISVSATDSGDNKASFSNYGDWIDVAAPGVSIYSTLPDNSYGYAQGTSMACPHVAGLIALILSEFPAYTMTQIYNLITTTAVDLGDPGFDYLFGWGRIDGISSIYGLQDHNVRTTIISPSKIPDIISTDIMVRVSNIGLYDETNLNVTLYLDDISVDNRILDSLTNGNSISYYYEFTPPAEGTYNFTAVVDPVAGEIVLADNVCQRFVDAVPKQIDAKLGDILAYSENEGLYPYDFYKWEIVEIISPTEYNISMNYFDPYSGIEFVGGYFILNPYTRQMNDLFDLFPFWINTTGFSIGTTFDFFTLGSNDAEVINETTVFYYGQEIPVWVVDDGMEWVYLDKENGVLFAVGYTNSSSYYFDMAFTNVIPTGYESHNLKVITGTSFLNGSEYTTPLFIQNTGLYTESSTLIFEINSSVIESVPINLDSEEYLFYDLYWTPAEEAVYNLSISLIPAMGETYLVDNYDIILFSTFVPRNYYMYPYAYNWFDARTNGYNLGVYGDDTYGSVDLPFTFEFYEQNFDTVYISSNGWMSFTETTPYEYWNPEFPSDSFGYVIAPFWDDLQATDNIYVWETADFVVIEFYNYSYLGSELIGNFEVILNRTGEIIFQYDYVIYDSGATIGLNYGLDMYYYTAYTNGLTAVDDFALLFTTERPDHELIVYLEAPAFGPKDVEYIINATVENGGKNNETDVEFELYLNDILVDSVTILELNVRETYTINYHWIPVLLDTYTVEAYAVPVPLEIFTANNFIQQDVLISDLKNYNMFDYPFHWYNAYASGDNLYIEGDDTYSSVSLPFSFYFYDRSFSTVYVSSNGWLSFMDSTPYDTHGFIPDEYNYHVIAPFWADLEASNNIYVLQTPEYVVIEYHNYKYLGGSDAGTFEVVLLKSGDILFLYESIEYDYGATKGLNYGFVTDFYNIYAGDLTGAYHFGLIFTHLSYIPELTQTNTLILLLMSVLTVPVILLAGKSKTKKSFQ